MHSQVTRRALLGMAPAVTVSAATFPFLLTSKEAAAQTVSPLQASLSGILESIDRAFSFQNFMMDAYATGSTVRLTQSYSDGGLQTTAFTYDNAVSIHAYLASEDPDLQARALVLGEGLLYAQANNFPFADGRFAQAYFVGQADKNGVYIAPAANPFYFYTSAVGDQAWAGMALAQLYRRTNDARFLTGALAVANWIVKYAYDDQGPGGYGFGQTIDQNNNSVKSTNGKSTEHNIDTFAFFTMLSTLTDGGFSTQNNRSWMQLAHHALKFVTAMYHPAGPYFYTGTQGNQVSINPYPIPEDCQTWSYMALLKNAYKGTIDWALANLETTDSASAPYSSLKGTETIHGLVFDTASLAPTLPNCDPNAVWLEGTAHAAAALAARVLRGGDNLRGLLRDIEAAVGLLSQCMKAQTDLSGGMTVGGKPIPSGEGLLAATSLMDTGFYYTYGPTLHIGATGWFLLAATAANPFQLRYRVIE